VSEFLNMGGYAAYVWPSYGLTLVIIVYNIVAARRLLARSREEARRRLAMREKRNDSAAQAYDAGIRNHRRRERRRGTGP